MSQLSMLHEQIKKKLKGGEGVDVGEWRAEPIISTVHVHVHPSVKCGLHACSSCSLLGISAAAAEGAHGAHADPRAPPGPTSTETASPQTTGSNCTITSCIFLIIIFSKVTCFCLTLQQGIDEGKPLFPIIRDRSASNSPRPSTSAAATASRDAPSTSKQPEAAAAVKEEETSSDSDDEPVITEQDLVESG